jgi:Sgf11 (transcriptional regulation protein)
MSESTNIRLSQSQLELATKAIYDDLFESICTNVIASELHERIKSGGIPYGDLSSNRKQLYPTLYSNQHNIDETSDNKKENSSTETISDDEIQSLLEKYSVEGGRINDIGTISDMKHRYDASDETSIRHDGISNHIDSHTKNELGNIQQSTLINESTLLSSGIGNTLIGSGSGGNNGGSGGVSTRQQSFTKPDIWGNIPLKEPREPVHCPICNRPINALRFAPHLDKCMGI